MLHILVTLALISNAIAASERIAWDFTSGDTLGWLPVNRVHEFTPTPEGLCFLAFDNDPYIEGPPVDFPEGRYIRVTIRMKSTAGAGGEVFYAMPHFAAGQSERFIINDDGEWHEYRLTLPPLGPGARLRLDPGVKAGDVCVAWIRAEALPPSKPPELAPPAPPPATAPTIQANRPLGVTPVESPEPGFVIFSEGRPMGFLRDLLPRDLGPGVKVKRRLEFVPDGPEPPEGVSAIRFNWEIEAVAEPVELYHIPWIELFAGLGGQGGEAAFGDAKDQALLAGVEYLENEPSSSEADVRGPKANRRIAADFRLTLPLMAVAHDGRWIGLMWDRSDAASPVFDGPDRIYNTKSSLMALWGPGVGERRMENELGAHTPIRIEPGAPLKFSATVIGGRGGAAVDAVKAWVALRGAPEPEPPMEAPRAVSLLASGWLDSAIHEDGQWRHAASAGSFALHPAADAPAWMLWLAGHAEDAALANRLREGARRGLERIPPEEPYMSGVGHVRSVAPALVFGKLEEQIHRRVAAAGPGLDQLDERGAVKYVPRAGGEDYGRTHFADHANGYSISPILIALRAAELSGDPALTARAIAALDKFAILYDGTVPRGAQTWEIPLHTPDILASAYIVEAFAIGYELTGRRDLLDRAHAWAWTGVPFVYLSAPQVTSAASEPGEVGLYATTAVLGATNWIAPYWIGLPVQWCGLVYGDALHRLARLDPASPDAALWSKLARGITAAGLAMTYPEGRPGVTGLLPDSFDLELQGRNPSDINPGTLQASLAELYGLGRFHDVSAFPEHGVIIHAPGEIVMNEENSTDGDALAFMVKGWPESEYQILIVDQNLKIESVTVSGAAKPVEAPVAHPRWRAVKVGGEAGIQVRFKR